MRYEYLILPPAPAPWPLRMLCVVRALFQHPGRALMIGLLLLLAATRFDAQQNPAQIEGRVALNAKVRATGRYDVGVYLAYDRTRATPSAALLRRVMELRAGAPR